MAELAKASEKTQCMLYRGQCQHPTINESFAVIVDDDNGTWVSDPPGIELTEPGAFYFSAEGALMGSKIKTFMLFPGGKASALP